MPTDSYVSRYSLIVVAAFTFACGVSVPAVAKSPKPKLDRALEDLSDASAAGPVSVIISAKSDCGPLLGRLVNRGQIRGNHPTIHAVTAEMLTTEEVSRFISPPLTTPEGFERFIDWTLRQRAAGAYVCFAIVPTGCDAAVGLLQFRASNDGFSTAEWGFALGSPYWGTGIFVRGAELALEFAFTTVGIHRLEARAAVHNGRGNAALHKLGAVQEAILRRSLRCRGQQLDQALWTLLADEWRPRHSHAGDRNYLIH
jgi:RimJ/RimL family protein N-acetyltransferase